MTTVDEVRQVLSRDLNRRCHCITLKRPALERSLEEETGEPGLWTKLAPSHPHLFSDVPLFVAGPDLERMPARDCPRWG